jgi:hypothetical protein
MDARARKKIATDLPRRSGTGRWIDDRACFREETSLDKPIDPALAAKAIAEGLAAFPKFAGMKPRLERIQLFKGSMLALKFDDDRREKGDPENFQLEKLVVKSYRALAGEG